MAGELNLALRRGPSVWGRLRTPAPEKDQLTGWYDTVGGAALVAMGLAIAAAGWQVLSRARYQSGARTAPQRAGKTTAAGSADVVVEGSEQSFPASDAPSWAAGRGKRKLAGREQGVLSWRSHHGRPSGRESRCGSREHRS